MNVKVVASGAIKQAKANQGVLKALAQKLRSIIGGNV